MRETPPPPDSATERRRTAALSPRAPQKHRNRNKGKAIPPPDLPSRRKSGHTLPHTDVRGPHRFLPSSHTSHGPPVRIGTYPQQYPPENRGGTLPAAISNCSRIRKRRRGRTGMRFPRHGLRSVVTKPATCLPDVRLVPDPICEPARDVRTQEERRTVVFRFRARIGAGAPASAASPRIGKIGNPA